MLAAFPGVFRVSDAVKTIRDSFLNLTNFENVILSAMCSLVFACFMSSSGSKGKCQTSKLDPEVGSLIGWSKVRGRSDGQVNVR